MKDIELFGRLKALGIPQAQAWRLTAKIRDELHPIAAVAAAKLHGAGGIVPRGSRAAGLGATTAQSVQIASTTAKVGAMAAPAIASAFGISAGAAAGSVVPIVGTVIGAAIGFLVGKFFGPAKLGQASVTWNDMVAKGYLTQQQGRAFDERYFGEALKGAMDEGNNVWPGCGPDRHKNPDCFFGPMSQVILAGYTSGKVPVTANTATVFQTVVIPWLASGANGLVNWQNLTHEPGQPVGNTGQELLLEAATDRYINGLPIVRGDMQAYAGKGYTTHEPSINSVLSQAPAVATVSSTLAPQAMQSYASVPSGIVTQAGQVAGQYYAPTPGTPPVNTSAGILQQLLAQNGVGMASPQAQGLVGQVATQGVQQTAYGPPTGSGSSLPSWLIPGGIAAVVAAKVLL